MSLIPSILDKILPKTDAVGFREFVTSKKFCGTEGIFDYWLDSFEKLVVAKGLVRELIMDGSLGGGKCVSGDSLILTSLGIRRIDTLVESP